jgi:hypothetical protein
MLLKKNNTTNLHREQAKGVFSSHQKKLYTPSHRMFEDTDKALNIDKNN